MEINLLCTKRNSAPAKINCICHGLIWTPIRLHYQYDWDPQVQSVRMIDCTTASGALMWTKDVSRRKGPTGLPSCQKKSSSSSEPLPASPPEPEHTSDKAKATGAKFSGRITWLGTSQNSAGMHGYWVPWNAQPYFYTISRWHLTHIPDSRRPFSAKGGPSWLWCTERSAGAVWKNVLVSASLRHDFFESLAPRDCIYFLKKFIRKFLSEEYSAQVEVEVFDVCDTLFITTREKSVGVMWKQFAGAPNKPNIISLWAHIWRKMDIKWEMHSEEVALSDQWPGHHINRPTLPSGAVKGRNTKRNAHRRAHADTKAI